MCAPKFSSKKRKKCLLMKTLGVMQGRAHHTTLLKSESFIYNFLGSIQTFRTAIFLETLFRTRPRIIKLGTKSL